MNLQEMLEDGVRYAPTYKPVNNSDHLPMTLCAMQGLGGTEGQLDAFRKDYSKRLHEWQPADGLAGWQDGLGRMSCYPALLGLFTRLLEAGDLEVRNEVLETCLSSIALEAFHPLIRLGFAVDFGSPSEEAAALAYLVTAHHELPHSEMPVDLKEQLLLQAGRGKLALESSRFGAGILELAATGRYPVGSAADLDEIAAVSLSLYRGTRNFFALHLVTSTQAMRQVVTPDIEPLAVACLTGAVRAAHLVLGSPDFTGGALRAPDSLDPEHCYKYVWACVSEYRATGISTYAEEADLFRKAGLVPGWVRSVLDAD